LAVGIFTLRFRSVNTHGEMTQTIYLRDAELPTLSRALDQFFEWGYRHGDDFLVQELHLHPVDEREFDGAKYAISMTITTKQEM